MPGFNPENINIHDLTIEEPEQKKEVFFDPEQDISEEQWKKLRAHWKNHSLFKLFYKEVRVLDPDIELNTTEQDFLDLKSRLIESQELGRWLDFSDALLGMKIIYPNTGPDLSPDIWHTLKEGLNEAKLENDWYKFSKIAMNAKILDPKVDMRITQEDLNTIRSLLELTRKTDERSGNWEKFIDRAMMAKIIDANTDLHLDGETWQHIKETLDKKTNDVASFTVLAAKVKMLAAKEVKIGDEGLEVVMPKEKESLDAQTPEMPEGRKF